MGRSGDFAGVVGEARSSSSAHSDGLVTQIAVDIRASDLENRASAICSGQRLRPIM
jgi:hypothetical protein